MEPYNRENLDTDLTLMVRAGLLELFMREDGQWVYAITDKAKKMTDEQLGDALNSLSDLDDIE